MIRQCIGPRSREQPHDRGEHADQREMLQRHKSRRQSKDGTARARLSMPDGATVFRSAQSTVNAMMLLPRL